MDVEIKQFEAMTVASVRHVGPYQECEVAWKALCSSEEVTQRMGPSTVSLGICYDDPTTTDADKIRYDACVTVEADFVPPAGIEKQEIGGGRYAVVIHNGPYDKLMDTYGSLYEKWLPGSGEEVAGPPLEVYLTCPETTPEEEAVTEIRLPLK